jgi:hypothetical protein
LLRTDETYDPIEGFDLVKKRNNWKDVKSLAWDN